MKTIKAKDILEIPNNYTGIIEWSNGDKEWYKNGKRYRTDGPAVECANGNKIWCKNGQWHRSDGPAFECFDGSVGYFINGEPTSKVGMEVYNAFFPKDE